MSAQLIVGLLVMIGVLALLLDLSLVQAIYFFALGFALLAAACAGTALLFRWLLKLLLAPLPRAVTALGASLALHGLAWWDGWYPLADLLPGTGAGAALGTLLLAHLPAAILLLRDLPEAGRRPANPNQS